jgi:hypothetical protein
MVNSFSSICDTVERVAPDMIYLIEGYYW